MAGAVHSKRLARIGQNCSDADCTRRPSDTDAVRSMLHSTGSRRVALNVVLMAVAIALMVVIAMMMYGRNDAHEDVVPQDSTMEGGVNKVVDSNYW